MRILFVTTDLNPTYGYGTYSHGLVRALEHAGHEVHCIVERVTPGSDVPQTAGLTSMLRHMRSPFAAYHTACLIERTMKTWQPDVIHFGVETYASSLVFLRTSIPTVMTAHGTYSYIPHLLTGPVQKIWSRFATKVAYQRLSRLYAVSTYTRNHMLKRAGWIDPQLAARIEIIPNGVSDTTYPVTPRPEKQPHTLLFVGWVKARKGPLEALEVVRAYHEKYAEPIRFRIVGLYDESNTYIKTLQKRIAEYGLTGAVTLEGEVSEERLGQLYAETDALIMLSVSNERYFEGFGLVYLEANARGIPVLGARGSGAEDAIDSGVSGILISRPSAAGESAEALHTIFTHPEEYRAGALAWAQKHAWSRIAKRYEESYAALRAAE